MSPELNQLMIGATAFGSWVAGMFFLQFWRKTKDRFFLLFAVAFWLMALNRGALGFLGRVSEHAALIYSVRLLAFGLIIVAIVDKNRGARAPR